MLFAEYTSNEIIAIIGAVFVGLGTLATTIFSGLSALWTAQSNALLRHAQIERDMVQQRTLKSIKSAAAEVQNTVSAKVDEFVSKASDANG